MLDQTFSLKNIRKIYDLSERQGHNPAGRYFPDVASKMDELGVCNKKIKSHRTKKVILAKDVYIAGRTALKEEQKKLKDEKEALLEECLKEVCEALASGKHKISLNTKTVRGKPAFTVDESAASFFAIKHVQRNLNRLYKVKQSDRNDIVCQLRDVLSDKMPKSIVRTDFESFYESVHTTDLMRKIEKDQLLSMTSKKIVKQVLYEYNKITGSSFGLPRGVGLSAYLSELFARDFDAIVKASPDLIYYSRYVDDIVAIYVGHPDNPPTFKYLPAIDSAADKFGLKLQPSKTFEKELQKGVSFSFEYLGYKFSVQDGKVTLDLSTNKIKKTKSRLKIAFETYDKQSKVREKEARILLMTRIRFLTGNTRLHNTKSNAYIGVFFSNKFLNSDIGLKALDDYLVTKTNGYTGKPVAMNLAKHSFKTGFSNVTFHRFSARQLSKIVSVWRHVS